MNGAEIEYVRRLIGVGSVALGEELYESSNLLRHLGSEEAFVGSPHWQSEKIERIHHYSQRFKIYTVSATSFSYFAAFSHEVWIFPPSLCVKTEVKSRFRVYTADCDLSL